MSRPTEPMTPERRAERRREKVAAAMRRMRERRAQEAVRELRLVLTAEQAAMLDKLRAKQRGSVEGFEVRALLTGAKFLANSGAKVGEKVKRVTK